MFPVLLLLLLNLNLNFGRNLNNVQFFEGFADHPYELRGLGAAVGGVNEKLFEILHFLDVLDSGLLPEVGVNLTQQRLGEADEEGVSLQVGEVVFSEVEHEGGEVLSDVEGFLFVDSVRVEVKNFGILVTFFVFYGTFENRMLMFPAAVQTAPGYFILFEGGEVQHVELEGRFYQIEGGFRQI